MAEKSIELSDLRNAGADIGRKDIERRDIGTVSNREVLKAAENDERSPEVDEIRGNIEATREKMGETIDAIQERLTVANISEQVKDEVSAQITSAYNSAKDTVYDATIVKAGRFMKNVKDELSKLPVSGRDIFPLALVGLGVGMFVANKRRGNGRSLSKMQYYGSREGERKDRTMTETGSIQEYGRGGREHSNVPAMLKSAQHKVTDVGERVYDNVTNAASTAYKKVSDVGHVAREQYDHQIEDNPLAVGIAAAALGAAVGMAIPVTRYENKLMGDTRDKLMSAAEDTTREAIHKVEDVAEQVSQTITEGSQSSNPQTGRSSSPQSGRSTPPPNI